MMRKIILLGGFLTVAFLNGRAQTKGTNTLGFGFDQSNYSYNLNGTETSRKMTNLSLGYGHFIKDNVRLGVAGTYGYTKQGTMKNNSAGGGVNLQRYYPLLSKFYAFAGASGTYVHHRNETVGGALESKGSTYFLGASGGASYFLSNRLAFEIDLMSAGLNYTRLRQAQGSNTTTSTDFNLSTSGNLSNMGFRIYLLF